MNKYQIEVLNSLLIEKVINNRIEEKVKTLITKKKLRVYKNSLLRKKQELINIKNISNILNIDIDLGQYFENIDQCKLNEITKEITSQLPFDKKRNKYIFSLAKENVPGIVLKELIKSTTSEFDKKLNDLPYAVLVRANIKRTVEYYDRTTKSLKSINTPM